MSPNWVALPRGSERARAGVYEADVWPVGGGWRWSVLDTYTGSYVASGQELTADLARAVAWQAALSGSLRKGGE